MIHLSSYHSNGMPAVVWSNRVNLIGEKVYKPKIHFCENCNKPILIYGRLIPCKHVFCFTCATLCLNQPSCYCKNQTLHRNESNHSLHKDNNTCSMNIDESTSNTTPTIVQQDTITSPNPYTPSNGNAQQNQVTLSKGCHRCGGRALRVERNVLNSIFVCHVDTCRRTYLSARDLQAHITHRHSRNKSISNNPSTSASIAAISSSPYISSSSLMHLNSQNNSNRQSSSNPNNSNNTSNLNSSTHNNTITNPSTTTTTSTSNITSNSSTTTTSTTTNNNNSSTTVNHTSKGGIRSPANNHHSHRRGRELHHHHSAPTKDRIRAREKERERYSKDRESYHRDRDTKEHHKQSLQRAAQWAEASAQMLEKGLTR